MIFILEIVACRGYCGLSIKVLHVLLTLHHLCIMFHCYHRLTAKENILSGLSNVHQETVPLGGTGCPFLTRNK